MKMDNFTTSQFFHRYRLSWIIKKTIKLVETDRLAQYEPEGIIDNKEKLPSGLHLVRDGGSYGDLIFSDDPNLFNYYVYKIVTFPPIS